MTPLTGPSAADDHSRFGLLPWLLPLFAASGCSALIYEIVWFQLLQLVIGSSAVSISVLLGSFMGGMCIGSLLLPRLVATGRNPLRVYALLECLLGVIGLAVLFGMPALDRAYGAIAGVGLSAVFERGILCALCLLPPTILMGATLPALARFVELTPRGVSWLGLLYGINILGAVVGCLAAGFYLLRVHNMAVATYAAAGLNGVVALVAYILAIWAPNQSAAPDDGKTVAERGYMSVYVTIALSGATALAAEVVWTRLLALLLGATVYTFSIILAVFLLGLAVGGAVGSLIARVSQRPAVALGWCQILLAGAIAWSAYALANSLPYWPIDSSLLSGPWLGFQIDIARCLWAVLPAACLWGASFPLALAAVPARGKDPGKLVGAVYSANTIGAILGAVLTSLVLIPWLGSQESQRVLIGLSTLAGLCVLLPRFRWTAVPLTNGIRVAGYVAVVALVGLLAWTVPPLPWKVVAFGRYLLSYSDEWHELYVGEGLNSSVAVSQIIRTNKPDQDEEPPIRNFHVSGKVEASTEPQDMRLQRMLGHLPGLLHSNPRTVLVVGCGAGVTAGSFVVHPEVEKIVICEIEPLVPRVVAGYFGEENHHVLEDPRVEVVYDDARHYLRTTPRKFDIITSDPIHPWVKGSATLYTKEYFEMCKRHLNPGGIVTQWVPLYESNMDVVKSEVATFFEAFPEGTVWENDNGGEGYDVVLLGQEGPITMDADAIQERLQRPDHALLAKSLKEVGFNTVVGLLGRYGGRASDLKPWLEGAQINRDVNLRLQYLAGLGLNESLGQAIRDEMLPYRRYPEDMFVGTGPYSVTLRKVLAEPPGQGSDDTTP